MVNDQDQKVMGSRHDGDQVPERLPAGDDFAAMNERSADELVTGLVSLGFIRVALRRGMWLWCTIAVVGLAAGFGLWVASPPAYQASTSVLLAPSPPPGETQNDQAIAQSRALAGLVTHKLRLRQSAASFARDYTVTILTDRVLLFTVKAASSQTAVREANTLATDFLAFRAHLLKTEEQLVNSSLQQQISQAQQHVTSISKQISQLSGQPASRARQAELNSLGAERNQATAALIALKQTAIGTQANTQASTTSLLKGSQVLDSAALIPQSSNRLLLYVGGGLIVGLGLGLGIVLVRALVSDRLRQRDDIAHALGASVRLSAGKVRLGRWRRSRRGLAAARSTSVQRIVAHLRDTMPPRARDPASLAVVPVDDTQVAAACLVSLAQSFAQQGLQVLVADLCRGTPAAQLLGGTDPGVRPVKMHDAHLVLAVPDRGDVVPRGPLNSGSDRAQVADALAAACASADVLLTLAVLDPSLGGEHLGTWATDAVVILTAGRSSWTRIHAVGEMIRLAGTRLVSAVLVGADKTDESLGLRHIPGTDHDADAVNEGLHSIGQDFFVAMGGDPPERRPDDL